MSTTTDLDLQETVVNQTCPQSHKTTVGKTCIMTTSGYRGTVVRTGGHSGTTDRNQIREGILKVHKI